MINHTSYEQMQDRVLNWVYTLQVAPAQFKMNEGADSTIFTTCFALFIFDLLGQVENWSQSERNVWSDYIISFQDAISGYFIPENYQGSLETKAVHQLTCFCLSALAILEKTPRYKLSFIDRNWPKPQDVISYLEKAGCFEGRSSTGNLAMFIGIFLTWLYEAHGDDSALERLNAWFEGHEQAQNFSTGFWGDSIAHRYYAGFQNAFHQFVIYSYWRRDIPLNENIVDIVLSLQDRDGYFAPVPGGGGCFDYDAADILINCGYKKAYRINDVKSALQKLLIAIFENRNDDGGFCESRKRPLSIKNVFSQNNLKFLFAGHNPYLWYYRLRATLSAARTKREKITTHWTRDGRLWHQSDLWNTWFRCLALAEIGESIEICNSLKKSNWKFHRLVGLGFFRKLEEGKGSDEHEVVISS